jgi:hypothetical protein
MLDLVQRRSLGIMVERETLKKEQILKLLRVDAIIVALIVIIVDHLRALLPFYLL